MSVGGYNKNLHLQDEKTHVISYDPASGFYDINIHSIKMDGMDLGFSKNDIPRPFVDSGTTLFFGPSRIINPMINAIK